MDTVSHSPPAHGDPPAGGPPGAGPGRLRARLVWGVALALSAVAATALPVVMRWQGADWPAQIYRVEVFRHAGWVGFDTGWYAGHAPLAYSTLFPPLAAVLGIDAVALGCAALATWAFYELMVSAYGNRVRPAALCFAAGAAVQVAVGQLSFLLGLTLALLALLSTTRLRRWWLGLVFGAACALASLLAAFFLALVALAWGTTRPRGHRRRPFVLAASAAAPGLVVSSLYGQAGRFPFPLSSLVCVLAACAGVWLVFPRTERLVRFGAVLYAAVAVALFFVPSPIGGVVTRLGSTVGLPIAVCAIPRVRRLLLTGALASLLVWQCAPAVGAVVAGPRDQSTRADYYEPLLAELRRVRPGPVRLEIPLTRDHWEAAWVAPSVSLARGWERQLDMVDNPLFYGAGALSAARYRAWLDTDGVTWVALPDVALDYSAEAEASLLQHGADFLQPVWHDAHWRLWRVKGSPGLVTGPARLTSLSAGGFSIVATRPGPVTVRVRSTNTWAIASGHGCLTETTDEWTRIDVARPGRLRVVSRLLPTRADAC